MKAIQEQAIREDEKFLVIKNLYLNFGVYQGTVKVLDGIDLEVEKAEVLGIVGETGCGKTMTARSILRLLEANAIVEKGSIIFEGGQNILDASEKDLEKIRGRKISMIFQEPMTSLNPTMRIGDQVAEGLLLHFGEDMIKKGIELIEKEKPPLSALYKNILEREINYPNSLVPKIASRIPFVRRYQHYPKLAARRESVEILRIVGMPSPDRIALAYPHELSGGMRQRVLIAIALACKPELIIADEPTSAVDVTTQAKILLLLLNLREHQNTTILIITHNIGVAAEICDRICVMYAGQIAEVGSAIDIINHPLHPYTRGLMGSIHNVGDKSELEGIEGNVPILLNPPTGCRFHPRCQHVMGTCSKKKPELKEIHEGHKVHCWLYQKEG